MFDGVGLDSSVCDGIVSAAGRRPESANVPGAGALEGTSTLMTARSLEGLVPTSVAFAVRAGKKVTLNVVTFPTACCW